MAHPIQIVELDEKKPGKLVLREKCLDRILNQPSLKTKPVMVLSVTGRLRKGKSFFLNLLIKYLSSNCSLNWTEDNSTKLKGFEWGGGPERITSGIWMWSEIFSIKCYGREVMVILMDTQGTLDPKASAQQDSALFALTTAISSIQVYNAISDINEGDMRFLELSINYSHAVKENTNPFQTLLFLIRDWQHPKTHKYGEDGGESYLNEAMEIESDSRKSIVRGFNRRMCFLLPFPPHKVVMGESDGRFSELSGDFLEQIDVLVKNIFSPDRLEALSIDGNAITCDGLLKCIKKYAKKLQDRKNLFDIPSPKEAAARAHNRKAYMEVISKCDEELKKRKGKYYKSTDDIFSEILVKAIKDFETQCQFLKCKEYDVLFERLQDDMQMKFQDFSIQLRDKDATARSTNELHKKIAVNSFKEEMNKKCYEYMEPRDLDAIANEAQQNAIQYYQQTSNDFGPSKEFFFDRLINSMTEMFNDFRLKNQNYAEVMKKTRDDAQKENEAYNAAKDAYVDKMYQIYLIYQDPSKYSVNHEAAREEAMSIYRQCIGENKNMPQNNFESFEEYVKLKRKMFQTTNEDANETAENMNNAKHNSALIDYRNEMIKENRMYCWDGFEELHSKLSKQALDLYDESAEKDFPCYEIIKKSLKVALECLKKKILEKRTFWKRLLNLSWIYKMFDNAALVIPRELLKE